MVTQIDFWKTHPFLSKFQFSGHELPTDFCKTHPYLISDLDDFPVIVQFRPQNPKIGDWMSFPDIIQAHGPILNKTEQVLISYES